ncbi:MAG: fumarylacetoacetate hydrolase family protein [Candidatus Kapaibacterium sp.]
MAQYVFKDGRKLDVGMIYCVGKNYSGHAREMGGEIPDDPVIFMKPPSSYSSNGSKIDYPEITNLLHYEVELVAVIGRDARNISPEKAPDYIAGYAAGIDLTLRDVQKKAKESGTPWAVAKGFYSSAPVSPVVPSKEVDDPHMVELALYKNGILKQKGNTRDMERSIFEIISYLSKVFSLRSGDCVFTGTPEGVGELKKGDKVRAELIGLTSISIEIV